MHGTTNLKLSLSIWFWITWRQKIKNLCVTVPFVCDSTICVWQYYLCVTVPFVCDSTICVWQCHLCVTVPFVCDSTICVWQYHLCVTVPFVCDNTICVWQYYLCVTVLFPLFVITWLGWYSVFSVSFPLLWMTVTLLTKCDAKHFAFSLLKNRISITKNPIEPIIPYASTTRAG